MSADLAHPAIAAAHLLGLTKAKRGLRVTVAGLAEAPGEEASADVIVLTDHGHAGGGDLVDLLSRIRATLAPGGVLALVVGSPVTRALVTTSSPALAATMAGRDDAYARAIVWAAERAELSALAPSLEPERLTQIAEAAAASGLTLVEPEPVPTLARIRGMRSARARALLGTIALGPGARPILFVPSQAAPKGGIARAKVERLTDGWVRATRAGGPEETTPETDLATAALALLRASARAGQPPTSFGDLLRDARERWARAARAHGGRATPSSTDARDLAAALHHRSAAGDVMLYALDPSDPGWTLAVR